MYIKSRTFTGMGFYDVFPAASLVIFILLIVINSFVLKSKGVRTGTKNTKTSRSSTFMYLLLLLAFLLWVVEINRPLLGISLLPPVLSNPIFYAPFLKYAGTIFISGSLLLLTVTLFHFGDSFRFGHHIENRGKLVTTGIFSVSRNPFFLSILLLFTGMALCFMGIFMIIMATATIVSIHSFILKEEKFMREMYGKEYRDYCNKTARYFLLF